MAGFLDGQIGWSDIVPLVRDVLAKYDGAPLRSVEVLRQLDDWSRATAREMMSSR